MPEFEIKNREIIIDKEINQIDEFLFKLLDILEKHTKYVIVGGYVSIFFGRSRATEDIDLFIEEISYEKFERLYKEVKENNYDFTVDNPKSLYDDYLQDNLAIRIWEKDFPLLTLEIKLAKTPRQKETLNNRITAKLKGRNVYFGTIEIEIAYKRAVLKGRKDLEDARHLEKVFKNLDKSRIEEYTRRFENDIKA
ncbi:hypothetical protein FJZ53_01840 [Candidatus Woesearchaeota archaeon]|nr:hypothetical protein [Candidatus Woesearchaeota archaeon]